LVFVPLSADFLFFYETPATPLFFVLVMILQSIAIITDKKSICYYILSFTPRLNTPREQNSRFGYNNSKSAYIRAVIMEDLCNNKTTEK